MKSLAAYLFSGFLLVLPVAAQHGGSHGGGGHGSGGSGFHGGGGHSGSVGGHGGYGGGYGGGYRRGGGVVGSFIPSYGYGYYGAPAYGYGFGDPGYGYAAPPPPDDTMDYGPIPQPAPPPDMSQYPQPGYPPGYPPLQIYQAPAPTPQEQAMNEGRYYLIAYKDHSIYTALAYWMENGVLNYVTPQNAHNQVSLDLLDLDLTKQLNARRGLGFNLVKP